MDREQAGSQPGVGAVAHPAAVGARVVPAPRPSAPAPSVRVQLAERARDAALATAGVADLDAGPAGLFMTVGGTARVAGVTCAVAPEGGYDVALRLVCTLGPLPAVAEAVRGRVTAIGAEEAIVVQTVTITVADIVEDAAGETR